MRVETGATVASRGEAGEVESLRCLNAQRGRCARILEDFGRMIWVSAVESAAAVSRRRITSA
jgi:hypothetical protein